ncbi:hypothetical protein OH809_04890 [Streptomyces sp. NBC_00873]|uniref:hypothetical protein n=1 Tax=unclassified Streptomyces TaxID=2593676 RepID=UPI0038651D28|nr:hypothetical protein OH809_04890 [Streptomyces sp. NBC_00873]WTA47822.1 hypothetical protein OH821_38900 [Streptomyces sp. NBC_00842]
MTTRTFAVTAAVAGAAVLATTGITYASAAGSTQAAPSVQQAAPAAAPLGSGDSGGRGNEGRDNGRENGRENGRDNGRENGRGFGHKEGGRIQFNERTYSAHTDGCITVVSGLGSRSFNVRNDSRRTVEVFNGATCDNGSPVATVGPWSSSNGVFTRFVRGGLWVKHGVVGSFRVVRDHHGEW